MSPHLLLLGTSLTAASAFSIPRLQPAPRCAAFRRTSSARLCMITEPILQSPTVQSNLADFLLAADAPSEVPPPIVDTITNNPTTDTIVFIIGLIPFAWATVEFWRRIAVGASFGTGQDSVVIIGEDGVPESSRGRRVLGKGALAVAYVLFGIAALAIGIAVYSVVVAPDAGGGSSVSLPQP